MSLPEDNRQLGLEQGGRVSGWAVNHSANPGQVAVELAGLGLEVPEGLVNGVDVLGEGSVVANASSVGNSREGEVVSAAGPGGLRVLSSEPANLGKGGRVSMGKV